MSILRKVLALQILKLEKCWLCHDTDTILTDGSWSIFKGREMKQIGFFEEMNLYANTGSIKDVIIKEVNYDKRKVIAYLENGQRVAICPRNAIDCMTGNPISTSFSIYNDMDQEYEWGDFLVYHIKKYNINLPDEFLEKIERDTGEKVMRE